MTQTEQGKHDEKLIAHYQNIIKSLQKQLETEQHERREIEKKSLKRGKQVMLLLMLKVLLTSTAGREISPALHIYTTQSCVIFSQTKQ